MGASAVGYRRYYAWVALADRADGVQHDAKALVRRKRIFPFLRVGEMEDVLVDGVRCVSGAWVLQKTDSSATRRGLHWPIVWMGFSMMRKRWWAENGFFRSYALERWGRFSRWGSVQVGGVGAPENGFFRSYALERWRTFWWTGFGA